ncbi:hypothetical protein TNCV_3809961 [Trichonephila clavipes]|nr:hypothetical protein TNCV_3809961 [Trichonephila clavipes]
MNHERSSINRGMIAEELQINHESGRQIVTQNLVMRKTHAIDIDDIPNILRNVTRLLNSISNEDFLQSFKDIYSTSQRCIVMAEDYMEGKVTFVNILPTFMLQDYSTNFIVRGCISIRCIVCLP